MTEYDGDFEWDAEKARQNLRNHGIRFQVAQEVFDDDQAVELYDEDHSRYEHRFNLIGHSSEGLLFVVFTVIREGRVRLISARAADPHHREYYEEELIKNNFPLE